jgi:uncharacterized protein (DUF362 family)
MKREIKRREFIKRGSQAICTAGLVLHSGASFGQEKKKKSGVVEVSHSKAVPDNRKIDQAIVRDMLKAGMKALADSDKPWSKYVKSTDRVGLKINCLGRPVLVTHHELVQAMIEDLKEFGVKDSNIIVWDRFESHMKDGKYEIKTSEDGVKCYASDTGAARYDLKTEYSSEADLPDRREGQYGTKSPFSKIFLEDCDKIINLAVLKDHGLAGVTLSLKNLAYGITTNNSRFHGPNHIGPFIADICARTEVRQKVVLHVIDGLVGCYENGPVPRNAGVLFSPKALWLSRDPVALDVIGSRIIEAERKRKGLLSLEETGRPPDHIQLAAERGVGVIEIDQIDLKRIALG